MSKKSYLPESSERDNEVVVRVEGASKKFCKSLKKSLWYGLQDVLAEVNPFGGAGGEALCHLRPDEFWAVDSVSFELRRGECLGLIGHNGAGKTTLLKMLNGLIKPDAGRIEMRGRVGALIALGAGFNPILTGRENIYVNAAILGLTKREVDEKIDQIIDFAEIDDFIDAPVQSYSSGMAVRLGFAVATAMEPDILLLDEVLAVGDVSFQAKCFNTIARFRERGTAFILVSHNTHHITRYSDRVLYLNHGRSVYCGDKEQGISTFLKEMNPIGSEAIDAHTDWSKVNGSGKVSLTSARFIDGKGREVNKIDPNEVITIEIEYKIQNELPTPPVLDLVIRDNEGVLFQATNSSAKQHFNCVGGQGRFCVRFPSIPVNSSHVDFSFAIMDGSTHEIFDWKKNVRLIMNNQPIASGKLVLNAKWTAEC